MNRRSFITAAVAALAMPLAVVAKPRLLRVNIWRKEHAFMKNRPFKDVRRGDLLEIVSDPTAMPQGPLWLAVRDAWYHESGAWALETTEDW